MKRIFLALTICCAVVFNVQAQEAVGAKTSEAKELSKEEKQKQKEKKDADMMAAFKEAGLNDEEIEKAKAINKEFGGRSTAVRKNDKLSAEEKEAELKKINEEKKTRMLELFGKDRYKKYNDAKKRLADAGA